MNKIQRFMGKMCDDCRLCQYARTNPETLFGRIMAWHGKWCPAWRAQKELEEERKQGE